VELHKFDRHLSRSIINVTLEQNWMSKISPRFYRIFNLISSKYIPREESSTHLHTIIKVGYKETRITVMYIKLKYISKGAFQWRENTRIL
jgi:hypothetical protein